MADPNDKNRQDQLARDKEHQSKLQKELHRGEPKQGEFGFMKDMPEQKPPVQPGEQGLAAIPEPKPTEGWVPKTEGGLHPDIVKKEANLALHAMRPQPRAQDIEVVLDVMFHAAVAHEQEYTEVDAIREAAIAKFKELFPLTNPAVVGETAGAAGAHP